MSPGRPVFLDITRIRFPVGAVASLGHRVSGVVLVVALPFAALALQRSLEGEAPYFGGWMRLPAALLAWAAAHHLFAGIRHLLMEAGIGASLPAARRSAYAALVAGALVGFAALVA
ncbi:MAG TPA: succinate dehydrogenase, cytochrome b556 subunit [Burkholderiales bacterium]